MDAAFKEEVQKLAETERRLDAMARVHEDRAAVLKNELSDFPVYDKEDRERKLLMRTDLQSELKSAEDIRALQPKPYFGRIDLEYTGPEEAESLAVYIGYQGIGSGSDRLVYDWRSPVGELYYQKSTTSFRIQVEKDMEPASYLLTLRRNLTVEDGQLRDCVTEYDRYDVKLEGEVADPFLLTVLRDKRRIRRLTGIIQTIQENQNRIIRLPRGTSFAVQGCAGSGKTMILLHRLSYLMYSSRNMDLSAIRIITPNPFFDAFIDDLSRELGLDSIARMPVEAYYTSLISRFTGEAPSRSEVVSEKDLDPGLMEKLYSIEYQEDFIRRYGEVWDRTLRDMDLPRLMELVRRFQLPVPSCTSRNADTAADLSGTLHSLIMRSRTSRERLDSARKSLEKARRNVSDIEWKLERNGESLDASRSQIILRMQDETARNSDALTQAEEKRDAAGAELEELNARLKALQEEEQNASGEAEQILAEMETLCQWDTFAAADSAGTALVRRELPDLVQAVESAQNAWSAVPAYNFVRRASFRSRLNAARQQFSEGVRPFLETRRQDALSRAETAQQDAERLQKKIRTAQRRFDSAGRECRQIRDFLSSCRTCLDTFQNSPRPDAMQMRELMSLPGLAPILSGFSGLLNSRRNLEKSRQENGNSIGRWEEEIRSLSGFVLSPEEQEYADRCTACLRSLQYGSLSRTVLYNDLMSQYRVSGQQYTSAGYRHKIYLQLLLCSLYYPRLKSPDTFLHIDEAQDISPAEYRLLRRVLGPRCVYNLYGDINQTVYSFKGLTDWSDVEAVTGGNLYVLNENYRNTVQITDFCNQEFEAGVTAIGISGAPVRMMEPEEAVRWILSLRKEFPDYRTAIIHRHGMGEIEDGLRSLLNGQSVSWHVLDTGRLSVLSAEEAKGLEFDAAAVFEYGMTAGEKYIAYTRALDNLTVVRKGFSSG